MKSRGRNEVGDDADPAAAKPFTAPEETGPEQRRRTGLAAIDKFSFLTSP